MDNCDKIKYQVDILINEQQLLRNEMNTLVRLLNGFVPLIVTFIGSIFAVIFSISKLNAYDVNSTTIPFVLIIINQVLFLVLLYYAILSINIHALGEYLAGQEKKLSALVDYPNLICLESYFCPKKLSRKLAFFIFLLSLFIIGIFLGTGFLISKIPNYTRIFRFNFIEFLLLVIPLSIIFGKKLLSGKV